ncbi:hypothetical protein [Ulvibacter antarcticus]|uniref:O-antigen ligase n=1 Tax=Ulvibacter antarcticus TaxID=442714 RepID=A0A3L9YFL8_9FLAO|nr:hypothetical protein [Ulvibacter antarcticus]RMA56738.1 O-antigen ligase [Ulvibacter antarcticus]
MFKTQFSLYKYKFSGLDLLLFVVYLGIFGYLILQPTIYYPATNSFWHVNINRYPVYVLFIRGIHAVVGQNLYDITINISQTLFALFAIHIFLKCIIRLIKLNIVLILFMLALLSFPLFPPLDTSIAIASEGLAYPLFLLFMTFTLEFLFRNKDHYLYLILPTYVLLVLTRGQFSIVIPVIILLLILKHKRQIFQKKQLRQLILLILIPFVANTLDSTYHKLVHHNYVTTPFSYINAITLPLFTSQASDSTLFMNEDHKKIFLKSYNRIDSLGLLSSKIEGSYKEKYMLFHNNFPYICNLNFYEQGIDYYFDKTGNYFKSNVDIEVAAKEMMPLLVKQNFKDWFALYVTNILHGFKSIFVWIFFIVVCLYSGWQTLKKFNFENALLFFSSLLININAVLVAFVVHTIIRYQFYYFAFAFIILIILTKKLLAAYETRT